MATRKTNRCVAYVSEAAWKAKAEVHFAIENVCPGWWPLVVLHDAPLARYAVVFDGADAEWTCDEWAGLPCIGMFGLDGDAQIGAVSAQAADLHAALLELFRQDVEAEAVGTSRETEGEATC